MKILHFYRFLLLVAFLTAMSCAPSFEKHFEKKPVFENGFSGFAVFDPATGKMLYAHNAHKYFTPASNIKILTFYASLNFLGDSIPSFKYKIEGDSLFFSPTGDPSFLNPKFTNQSAFDFLKNSDKHLAYVRPNWQDEHFGSGWAWDDYPYYFSAEKSAFPVYGNLIKISSEENASEMKVFPSIFEDSIKTINSSENKIQRKLNSNQIDVQLSKDHDRIEKEIPFKTSETFSLKLLKDTLQKNIKLSAERKDLQKVFYNIAADSLYKTMLHDSDNFIAEQLLLMISEKISDSLKTDITIRETQKQFLKNLPDSLKWVDGSGLSRYNLATPADFIAVLDNLQGLKNRNDLKELFPTLGKEGTVKNMLSEHPPFVYAKTGSMGNVYNISGYLETKKGRWLIFSFMNNNFMKPTSALKKEIGKMLLEVRNKY